MKSALQDFCESGVQSPVCEARDNWFGINSYELGFNENIETLPASYYDPQLNQYVRDIPVQVATNNSAIPTILRTDFTKTDNTLLPMTQPFSISSFIQANPGLSLVIGLGLGYLVLKAVK